MIIVKKPVLSSYHTGYSWSCHWASSKNLTWLLHLRPWQLNQISCSKQMDLFDHSPIRKTNMSISNLYLFIFSINFAHVWYFYDLIVKDVLKTSPNSLKFVFIKTFQIASYLEWKQFQSGRENQFFDSF